MQLKIHLTALQPLLFSLPPEVQGRTSTCTCHCSLKQCSLLPEWRKSQSGKVGHSMREKYIYNLKQLQLIVSFLFAPFRVEAQPLSPLSRFSSTLHFIMQQSCSAFLKAKILTNGVMKHSQFPSVFTSMCCYNNVKHDNHKTLHFSQTLI